MLCQLVGLNFKDTIQHTVLGWLGHLAALSLLVVPTGKKKNKPRGGWDLGYEILGSCRKDNLFPSMNVLTYTCFPSACLKSK